MIFPAASMKLAEGEVEWKRNTVQDRSRSAVVTTAVTVTEHGFFGCRKETEPVEHVMDQLRGGRHRDR